MATTSSQRILQSFSRKAAGALILIGALALLASLVNIPAPAGIPSQYLGMNRFSALLFLLSGIALYRVNIRPSPRQLTQDQVALVCISLIIGGGALKLAEFSLGFHTEPGPGFWSRLGAFGSLTNNELAPNTALNFLFCGIGLLFLDFENRRGCRPAQFFFVITALISLLALIGYAFPLIPLHSVGSAKPMSLNNALTFELLALAGLGARPDKGMMAVITSDTIGGSMARRLLPAAILIPLVLAAIRRYGEGHGYFDTAFGMSLFAVANVILFTSLIWWTSRMLSRAERQRQLAERRLSVQYAATRVLAESPNPADARKRILKAICSTLKWQVGIYWSFDESTQTLKVEATELAGEGLEPFAEISRRMSFARGTGLPGRVLQSGMPAWIHDVAADQNFPRSPEAEKVGLRSGFAFPVRVDHGICAVIELFSRDSEPSDEVLLDMLASVGHQLGQFMERKRAEEQLKQTSAELARSNTDLQQFAYVASHDLTEPLRMVASYLQVLKDRTRGKMDAEAEEFIDYAVDGAIRMQALIRDLLAYARVDTRGRSMESLESELALHQALANLRVTIEETGAVIEHDALPMVQGDLIQITQVFQNLIGNAIKFRGRRTPRIRIEAGREGDHWVFHVTDNGIGINPRDFDRIFVLFQRLHTRQEYPGTGMGLAICKKIIERHGGRIWIQSAPGQGTRFSFTLPAAVTKPGPRDPQERSLVA